MTFAIRNCGVPVVLSFGVAWASAGSQTPQPGPAVRPLGPIVAVSPVIIGSAPTLRQLADGRLLVNDKNKRRLLLLDSSMTHATLVADSARGTATSYGSRPGVLIPYLADSTLFLDVTSLAVLVFDPAGGIARVGLPSSTDALNISNASQGTVGTDAQGRLVYQGVFRRPPAPPPAAGTPQGISLPDSAPLIRGDFTTHHLDTVSYVMLPWRAQLTTLMMPDGKRSSTMTDSPIPLHAPDVWSVSADGAIAIVRGEDYHVDWFDADGKKTATPRVAHQWTRVTDDEKAHLVDSIQQSLVRMNAQMEALSASQPGLSRTVRDVVPATQLPDYRPAFPGTPAVSDYDGNIWIQARAATNNPLAGIDLPGLPGLGGQSVGAIYEVIDRHGTLVDRVQLPEGYQIVGFGRGVVFMMPGSVTGAVLAKASIR